MPPLEAYRRPVVAGTARSTTVLSSTAIRSRPVLSAREVENDLPAPLAERFALGRTLTEEPYRGITTDGKALTNVFRRRAVASTASIAEAANAFLQALDGKQSAQAVTGMGDDLAWRRWNNAEFNVFRHGVLLEALSANQRLLALRVAARTLSAGGYARMRNVMRLNEHLRLLTGADRSLGEWLYFLTIFGDPGQDAPWGWQLDGHHLVLNALVLRDQLLLSPTFLGAEPTRADKGPYAGIRAFTTEETSALALVNSLDRGQLAKAVLFPSLRSSDLPLSRTDPFEGRLRTGMFQDNAIIPYEGLPAVEMTFAQRQELWRLVAGHLSMVNPVHARARLEEVKAYESETHFAWIGGRLPGVPFYYKVHNPAVIVEFDHHKGVFLDNDEPTRHHGHAIVRSPNGNDYGRALLSNRDAS